jgi:hypothetical protein
MALVLGMWLHANIDTSFPKVPPYLGLEILKFWPKKITASPPVKD